MAVKVTTMIMPKLGDCLDSTQTATPHTITSTSAVTAMTIMVAVAVVIMMHQPVSDVSTTVRRSSCGAGELFTIYHIFRLAVGCIH